MTPSRATEHPGTGSASAVTAAITTPARSRSLVRAWGDVQAPRGGVERALVEHTAPELRQVEVHGATLMVRQNHELEYGDSGA